MISTGWLSYQNLCGIYVEAPFVTHNVADRKHIFLLTLCVVVGFLGASNGRLHQLQNLVCPRVCQIGLCRCRALFTPSFLTLNLEHECVNTVETVVRSLIGFQVGDGRNKGVHHIDQQSRGLILCHQLNSCTSKLAAVVSMRPTGAPRRKCDFITERTPKTGYTAFRKKKNKEVLS